MQMNVPTPNSNCLFCFFALDGRQSVINGLNWFFCWQQPKPLYFHDSNPTKRPSQQRWSISPLLVNVYHTHMVGKCEEFSFAGTPEVVIRGMIHSVRPLWD